MGAIFGTIVSFVQSYVQAVVVAIVGSTLTAVTQALVVNLLTAAVLLIVTGAVLQVVGKLLGIEKVTDGIAKVLYMIAIVIIAVAAFLAQSLMLGLVFLGAAFAFLFIVDSVFGTNASKTFTDAAVEIVKAVADVVTGAIGAVVDVIGTGLSSLFGGNFFTYLMLGVAGYIGYKVLTKPDNPEIVLNDSAQKYRGALGGGLNA